MVTALIFLGFILLLFILIVFSGGEPTGRNNVLNTKDGLYRKNPNKGYVSPIEMALLGEKNAMKAIDISKINVESFGRRRGAFGKWGYCVTNPVCIYNMDNNLQTYISHLCYENSRVESYDTTEVYNVSIFDNPVYKISLQLKNTRKEICLYFIESKYMNTEMFPDGFSDYSIYEKKQQIQNSGNANSPRFSLRGNYREEFSKLFSLEKYENSIKRNDVLIKSIWKK